MEFAVLGGPDEGPTLRLDHREFAYAGKFVMSNTGKAVARDGETLVGAVAFNADRTDDERAWLRYVTVREGRRGDGVGARLCGFAARYLLDGEYAVVRIAVNNPFAYEALHKAGFGFIGETTGLAELVLERPSEREHYDAGLDLFRERDLTDPEESFLASRDGPPSRLPDPDGVD